MQFLLIDDDPLSNMICQLTLQSTLGQVDTKSFTNPQEGLSFLQHTEFRDEMTPTVLLLDLNMPIMSGWEFLDRFDALPLETKRTIRIFILSSSIDVHDKARSYANKNVKNFITKPLTAQVITDVLTQ
jgi:CheY-like chemotaxis protein